MPGLEKDPRRRSPDEEDEEVCRRHKVFFGIVSFENIPGNKLAEYLEKWEAFPSRGKQVPVRQMD